MENQIGEWRVGDAIAHGGMSIVYAARHATMPGEFAVKEIRPELTLDRKARAYFIREAENAVKLTHPNIVRTLEKVEVGKRIILAMERLRGDTLESLIKTGGPNGGPRLWSAEAALPIVHQISAGLGYAHERSIVHRDVKPSNVFVEASGRVKVLDFGICRVVGEASLQSTRSGPPGTPAYMPPEVLLGGAATPASDVFSLGLIAFRLVTGRLPHDVPEDRSPWVVVTSLVKAYTRDLPRVSAFRPDIPRAFDLLVAQMLSVDPLQRPRNGAHLAALLSAQQVEAKAALAPAPPPPPLAGTALGVLGVQQHAQRRRPPEAPPWGDPIPSDPAPSPAYASPPNDEPIPGTRLAVDGLRARRARSPSGFQPPAEPAAPAPAAYAGPPGEPYARTRPEPEWTPLPDEGAVEVDTGEGPSQTAIWGLAGLVLVLGVVIAVLIGRSPTPLGGAAATIPATEGWIEVRSEPSGAQIELEFDGRVLKAVTPHTFTGLSTRRGVQPATLWIRAQGHQERKFVVPVVPGLEQHVNAALEPR